MEVKKIQVIGAKNTKKRKQEARKFVIAQKIKNEYLVFKIVEIT